MPRPPRFRPRYVASPDSSSSLLLALAAALQGRGFPLLGLPRVLQPVLPALNLLPKATREILYGRSAWLSAMPPSRLGRVSAERAAQWMTHQYEWRRDGDPAIGARRFRVLVHGLRGAPSEVQVGGAPVPFEWRESGVVTLDPVAECEIRVLRPRGPCAEGDVLEDTQSGCA
jgi:hypothetical protein